MDKTHFILRKRYKAILTDGSEVVLDLTPEDCYYFDTQEIAYLIKELRYSNIDISHPGPINCPFKGNRSFLCSA